MKKLLGILFALLLAPLILSFSEGQAWGAWGDLGSVCTNSSKTSGTTLVCNFGPGADRRILCITGWDNTDTADGQTTRLSIADDQVNSWLKVGEFTNTNGGAAADGSTVAAFISANTTGTFYSITITSDTARIAKAVKCWLFTAGAGNSVSLAGTLQTSAGSGSAESMTISGLTSREYLFVRNIGYESNAGTTGLTATASYTTMGIVGTDGGGEASNMGVAGELRILTATGDTSDPTFTGDTSHDDASLYFALQEAAPAATISKVPRIYTIQKPETKGWTNETTFRNNLFLGGHWTGPGGHEEYSDSVNPAHDTFGIDPERTGGDEGRTVPDAHRED